MRQLLFASILLLAGCASQQAAHPVCFQPLIHGALVEINEGHPACVTAHAEYRRTGSADNVPASP